MVECSYTLARATLSIEGNFYIQRMLIMWWCSRNTRVSCDSHTTDRDHVITYGYHMARDNYSTWSLSVVWLSYGTCFVTSQSQHMWDVIAILRLGIMWSLGTFTNWFHHRFYRKIEMYVYTLSFSLEFLSFAYYLRSSNISTSTLFLKRIKVNRPKAMYNDCAFRDATPLVWNRNVHRYTDDISSLASFRRNTKTLPFTKSFLYWLPWPVRNCDSSIDIASHTLRRHQPYATTTTTTTTTTNNNNNNNNNNNKS